MRYTIPLAGAKMQGGQLIKFWAEILVALSLEGELELGRTKEGAKKRLLVNGACCSIEEYIEKHFLQLVEKYVSC